MRKDNFSIESVTLFLFSLLVFSGSIGWYNLVPQCECVGVKYETMGPQIQKCRTYHSWVSKGGDSMIFSIDQRGDLI